MPYTTFTYDTSTDIGRIRRTLGKMERSASTAVYTDEEIQSYLTDEGSNWRLAAAAALEDLASDQTLILQVMSDAGYSVNGATMAADLRKRADALRQQVIDGTTGDLIAADTNDSGFDIAETDWEGLGP